MNDELFRKEGPSQEEKDGAKHRCHCHLQKASELSVSVSVAEDRLISERHADRDKYANWCSLAHRVLILLEQLKRCITKEVQVFVKLR